MTVHTCAPCSCGSSDPHCKHAHDPWFNYGEVRLVDDVDVNEELL